MDFNPDIFCCVPDKVLMHLEITIYIRLLYNTYAGVGGLKDE